MSSDKVCFGNQWPADEFFEQVEEAVSVVLGSEPDADPEIIRGLVLFEWLGFSYAAGTA